MDEMNSDRSSERELNHLFQSSSDSFNKVVADNTIHKIDVSSTHPFNSERLKYLENGVDTDFSGSAKTTDDPTKFVLNADAGDILTIESRQRMRYIPGYEIFTGIAWYAANSLDPDQEIIVSLGNGDDAFRAVYGPDFSEYRLVKNGTVTKTVSFSNPVVLTQPQIDQTQANMYGVGTAKLSKSFVENTGEQKKKEVTRLFDLNEVITNEFNLKMRITLDCGNASTGNSLNVLSMQGQDLGNATPLTRKKGFTEFGLGGSINSTGWTPLLALRKDNNRESILYSLTGLSAIPSAKMKIAAVAVSPGQTDATGFSTPEETNPENDATEITTSVTTPTDPQVGRQTGFITVTSQNLNQSMIQNQDIQTPVYDDDVIVFMAKTESASNASTDLVGRSTQEW